MRKILPVFAIVLLSCVSLNLYSQNLIQATLKAGPAANQVEVWLKPNFSNTTQYIFQVGIPIAWPASLPAGQQPNITSANITLDPAFIATTGNTNTYPSITVYSGAHNTANTENYVTINLMRSGVGASNPQTWTAGIEFKLMTITFLPYGNPGTPVKLGDYQDGGSDGQGNFYTVDGNANYYVTSSSAGNFYGSGTESATGGSTTAGYVQTTFNVPRGCAAPSTPNVTNIGTTSADISWGAVSGVAGYEYVIDNNPSDPSSAGIGTTNTNTSPTALNPSTLYYVHVRSNCGAGGYSAWVSASFTTQTPTCTAPSGLTASVTGNTSADISWNTVNGVVGYQWVIDNSAADPTTLPNDITGTSTSQSSLVPGTTYYVHIRSNCGSLYSSWAYISFTIPCPSTPTASVDGVTTTHASFNWSSVSGAIAYEYFVSTSSAPPASGIPINAISHDTTTLEMGTQYYFYVRTKCASGSFSGWTSVPFATTCPAPIQISVNGISPTGATFNWTEIPGSQGYQYVVTTSPTPPASGTLNFTPFFTNIPSGLLTQGTQYYVHVRSNCSPGIYSNWVDSPFSTTYPPCNAPVSLTVSNINNSAHIVWSSVNGAIGYEYAITTNEVLPNSGIQFGGTIYDTTGLSSNTKYYVYVRAQCSSNRYSQWIKQSFTSSCFKPVPFVIKNMPNAGTADLGWFKINGAIEYEYAILNSSAPPISSLNLITDTILHANNLKEGNKYYLHIRTHCSSFGISEWSTLEFYASGIATFVNPSSRTVTITIYGAEAQSDEIEVFDMLGRLLKNVRLIGSNTTVIDMSVYSSGIYLIRYGRNEKYVRKIRL